MMECQVVTNLLLHAGSCSIADTTPAQTVRAGPRTGAVVSRAAKSRLIFSGPARLKSSSAKRLSQTEPSRVQHYDGYLYIVGLHNQRPSKNETRIFEILAKQLRITKECIIHNGKYIGY